MGNVGDKCATAQGMELLVEHQSISFRECEDTNRVCAQEGGEIVRNSAPSKARITIFVGENELRTLGNRMWSGRHRCARSGLTLVIPGWLRRNRTPARTSSAISSQLTDASLFLNLEFMPRTLKPRCGNSCVDTCARLVSGAMDSQKCNMRYRTAAWNPI